MQFSTTWRIVLSLVRNVCTNTNTSTSTSTSGPPLVRAVVVEEEENAPTLSATLSACIMRGHPTPYQLRAKQKTCRFRKISFFTCMICLTLATHGITHSEKHTRETLLIVCHPDDESIFGASALGERTHVVVVTDANSSGKGTKRKAYLENAMKITGSSWDMWDLPESKYKGPKECNGWNTTIQDSLIIRLERLFSEYSDVSQIVTHNVLGEYGHVDHRNTHMAVVHAFVATFAGKLRAPRLKVFVPVLNYTKSNRLGSLPTKCGETELHKSLLDSYERDGGLGNAGAFRNVCYSICSATMGNSILDEATFYNDCSLTADRIMDTTCESHIQTNGDPPKPLSNTHSMQSSNDRTVLLRETPDIDAFWRRNEDRIFMTKFYQHLAQFETVLDIGARRYNLRCKGLIGQDTKYFQLEPNPPDEIHNDGTLRCLMQDAVKQYPQFVNYFQVIVDFGVLGWPAIQLSKHEVREYIRNTRALLTTGGLYILKVDRGALERINFEQNIEPFFEHVPFAKYSDGQVIDSKEKRIYFLRKR